MSLCYDHFWHGSEVYEAVTSRIFNNYGDVCGGDLYQTLSVYFAEQEPATVFISLTFNTDGIPV